VNETGAESVFTAAFLPETHEKPFLFRGKNGNHRVHKNELLLYSY